MLGEKWICDRTPTARFPGYTRANAGEVLADPVSPLGWTFCWESGVVLGCRDGFVSFGVFDPDEYGTPPETFGLFGGYFYNSLMQARLMGVRMPGASPEAIDKAYFDEHPDVPPYIAEPWHESPAHSDKLAATMGLVMSTDRYQPIDDQKVLTKRLRAERPDLAKLSDGELLARARSMQPHIVALFEQHVWASLGASLGPGAIGAICEAIGRGPDAIRLLTGIGDVDSAEIARDLWKLSRMVRESKELTAAFDGGIDGVLAELDGALGDTAFGKAWVEFIYEHGSRGPNEWDCAAPSYETKPQLALAQLDSLRKQGDEADPIVAFARNAADRARLAEEIGEQLAGDAETAGTFNAAYHSAALWLAVRERCKNNNIRAIHEVRMCFDEIGRRAAGAGHLAHPGQIYMLLESELDEFLAKPASFTSMVAERETDYHKLFELEPPFIVNGTCPPITSWQRKADMKIAPIAAGDVLKGVACSPGTVSGRARVLTHSGDPGALEPGDILVTMSTDPSWTPLFLAAGAVVTSVGALGSHASIVSRELGIPCVASVADAHRRIPDGAMLTVDGTAGTVTVTTLS